MYRLHRTINSNMIKLYFAVSIAIGYRKNNRRSCSRDGNNSIAIVLSVLYNSLGGATSMRQHVSTMLE
jgi:hypothetical protein